MRPSLAAWVLGVLSLSSSLAGCSGEGEEASRASEDEVVGMQTEAPGCSASGFSKVTDCRNTTLPPPPSIRRRFVRPRRSYSEDVQEIDAARTKAFSGRSHSGNAPQTFVLPPHRTSVDGRIATVATGLALFSPENLNPGFQTIADPARRPLSHNSGIYYDWRMDPRPGKSRIPQSAVTNASGLINTGLFWEMCNGTNPDASAQVRKCRAKNKSTENYREGDCYDVSYLWSNFVENKDGSSEKTIWELRSIDLTLFVPAGKVVPTASVPFWEDGQIWGYPRSMAAGLTDLPPHESLEVAGNLWHKNPDGSTDYSFPGFVKVWSENCKGGNQPGFCKVLDEQRVLPPSENYRYFTGPGVSHSWTGEQGGSVQTFHGFLEPASTADGRVVFMHDYGQGIVYSYNKVGPCDARGFKDFKPLSMAYLDPDVNTKYGFAKYPVRNSQGVAFAPGATVIGAYPWVDRKGNNLMFPAGDGQDGWVGTWKKNFDQASFALDGQEVKPSEVNIQNSTGVLVVGSWTRGKMVVVDNGLNATDWSFSQADLVNNTFHVPLYKNGAGPIESVPVRPGGTALLNSYENSQTFYNVQNPLTPQDVVWVASSTQERNAEIAFDDYLRKGMRIVAHMNAPLAAFATGNSVYPNTMSYDNGFVPQNPLNNNSTGRKFKFKRTPRLQNSATGTSVPVLELRGGAWIPPVAEGGVLGRGVYLDGVNDHVLVTGLPARVGNFFLGLWLDLRDSANASSRTLYRFGAGTEVRIRPGRISFVSAGGTAVHKDLPAGAAQGRYFHLGLAFNLATGTSGTEVAIWVDGSAVGSVTMAGSPSFAPSVPGSSGPFACGANSPSPGWQCSGGGSTAVLCQNGQVITTSQCSSYGMVCSENAIASGQSPCVDAGAGRMSIGMDRSGNAPLRAYIDEFRMLDLEPSEHATLSFQEQACNMALGSLKTEGNKKVCQQIDFRHNEPADADGIGVGLDFPMEAYTNDNCGNSIHRTTNLTGCSRGQALDLADKQLVASLERPDFHLVSFCTTCHVNESDPVEGLRPSKLLPGTVAARLDSRRQPMAWFRTMNGVAPVMNGQPVSPFSSSWNGGYLDDVILGASNTAPPKRIGPF